MRMVFVGDACAVTQARAAVWCGCRNEHL